MEEYEYYYYDEEYVYYYYYEGSEVDEYGISIFVYYCCLVFDIYKFDCFVFI